MNRRIMEDIKLDSSKVHRIIKSDHHFNIEPEIKDTSEEITARPVAELESDKNIEDKVDKYINYRYAKKNPEIVTQSNNPQSPLEPIKPKSGSNKSYRGIFLFIILVLAVYLSATYFEKATVSVTPKTQSANLVDKQFIASKAKDSDLGFEIMIMSGEETKKMTLSQTENISIKATGNITLNNEFSKTSQNLLMGTFLSDEAGKTYRLNQNVKIPGYTLDKENKIIPGTIDVAITAFLPGESYNGNPTNFQIVGFKGTAKYTKIYGKAKGPIKGGKTGLVYVLSETEKAGIMGTADSIIKSDLQKKLAAEIPEGYIYYPGAITYSYDLRDGSYYDQPSADVAIAYNLSVVLLKKDELTRTVIKNLLPKVAPLELSQIRINDLSKLSFAFMNTNQYVNKELESVTFSLSGPVDLLWNPNLDAIKNEIVGLPKSTVANVFNTEPGIAKAEVKIFPPWQQKLPLDIHRIKMVIR